MAQKNKVTRSVKPVLDTAKKTARAAAGRVTRVPSTKEPAKKIAAARARARSHKAAAGNGSSKVRETKKTAAASLAKRPIAQKPMVQKPIVQKAVAAAKPLLASKPATVKAAVKSPVPPPARAPITVGRPGTVRAVPATLAKASGQKITAPLAPATPKAIAEKAAAARRLMATQKKPVSQRHGFKTNEFVVYPAHGVGRIVGIEEQEIAGMSLELFVINFDKEKLTLRVPTGKLASVGMRKLADEGVVKKAMDTLKGRARVKRTMWSRRAQEYVAKINSGDLISIAEVVRDLYRSEAQPEQSYSERQLYEDALDRMAREIAAVEKLDERGAVQRITEVLSKSARGRRIAEGTEAEVKAA